MLIEELKKNASQYNNNIMVTPKILHFDFEKGISNATIKIFPNITIKYCVWHYKRSLEVQKKINYFIMKLKIIIKFICFIKPL